jgi:transcriptional regulator with XRE-family HTH domain
MKGGAMKIEAIIGGRVREAREKLGWTQAQVGVHLFALLGEPWSPQAVSQAEKGRRDFRAADLFALAVALDRPVEWFFEPPEDEDAVDLPGSRVTWTPDDSEHLYVVEPKSADQTLALLREWFTKRGVEEKS